MIKGVKMSEGFSFTDIRSGSFPEEKGTSKETLNQKRVLGQTFSLLHLN